MIRFLACAAVLAVAAPASGDTPGDSRLGGRRITVEVPPAEVTPAVSVSNVIYLERCKGTGCTIQKGVTNATTYTSNIVIMPGKIGEFLNAAARGNPAMKDAAATETEWAALVQCVKEVYSPYKVTVTDVKPTAAPTYHMAIAAGQPQDIGFGTDILGVAPLSGDCSAQDNAISFSFANAHPMVDPTNRMLNICWTVAQESAHAFGLDHEFMFDDGSSTCSDPMTYRNDCGGEKFYRNQDAQCGEFMARTCKCGGEQNSHKLLLDLFGAGTPLTGPPTVSITTPAADGGAIGTQIIGKAFSKRGVARVELILNGHKWATAKGVPFGADGQPEAPYGINIPAKVPDGNYDVVLRAVDDLETATESAVRTAVKGAPCVTADTCLNGQRCEAGKCFWDPPSGEVGDACTYDEFCKSNLCTGTKDQTICTQDCVPGAMNGCPMGLDCIETSKTTGVCFYSGGGCCSVSNDTPERVLFHAAICVVLLGRLVRRRRK
jgi:hypothetical protein